MNLTLHQAADNHEPTTKKVVQTRYWSMLCNQSGMSTNFKPAHLQGNLGSIPPLNESSLGINPPILFSYLRANKLNYTTLRIHICPCSARAAQNIKGHHRLVITPNFLHVWFSNRMPGDIPGAPEPTDSLSESSDPYWRIVFDRFCSTPGPAEIK